MTLMGDDSNVLNATTGFSAREEAVNGKGAGGAQHERQQPPKV